MPNEENVNLARQSKKRKRTSHLSSQDLDAVTDDENQSLSPKQRNKIPIEALNNSSLSERNHCIGAILTLPDVQDGKIRKGEVKNVKLFCTVTENKTGRTVTSDGERNGQRFIYLADCTGYLSLNVNGKTVGIRKHDIPNDEYLEGCRSFFNAIVTGCISWEPSWADRERPTFFLNRGGIEKIELNNWFGHDRFMLPTTDVCQQMVKSRYGGNALFGTTGICGRVDKVCVNQSGVLKMSLEDPVGYSAVEIHPVRDDETAESLNEEYGIAAGVYLFIKGKIHVDNFPRRENAVLIMASTDGSMTVISSERFSGYVKALCGMDSSFFKGVIPEDM